MYKLLQFLVVVENIWGLFRNFDAFGRVYKCLISVYIIIQTLAFIKGVYFSFSMDIEMVHVTAVLLSTIFILFLTTFRSKMFVLLMERIRSSNQFSIKPCVRRIRWITTVCLLSWYAVISFSFEMYFFVISSFTNDNEIHEHYAEFIFMRLVRFVTGLRFVIELTVIWAVYISVADRLKYLVFVVNEDIIKRKKTNGTEVRKFVSLYRTIGFIDECVTTYGQIKNMVNICNNIFYWQTTAIISTTVIFYVAKLYKDIECIAVKVRCKAHSKYDELLIISHLIRCEFLLATCMVLFAGQQVKNNLQKLKQLLSWLLNNAADCGPEYSATRAFLRLVESQPAEVQAFGTVVDMRLLPVCFGLIVTQVVVFLQFNNIV